MDEENKVSAGINLMKIPKDISISTVASNVIGFV